MSKKEIQYSERLWVSPIILSFGILVVILGIAGSIWNITTSQSQYLFGTVAVILVGIGIIAVSFWERAEARKHPIKLGSISQRRQDNNE